MATVYVRAANPIWWLPDLTGVSLNDEYWAFFLTNTLPYIPQAVYQEPDSLTADPWSNPVQFSAAGTLPDNLYFNPNLVYRIEVRHGNTQSDPLIWEIQNFVPGSSNNGTIVTDKLTVAANLITNPQFADIYFVSPYTYEQTPSGTYTVPIGPGWDLILTGANGRSVITQTAVAGTSHVAGNPPYFLEIENTGWTSAVLRQRLENNGAIFGGGAIAVAFTAASVGSAEVLTVSYSPNGAAGQDIFSQSIPTGSLVAYKNAINVDASTNSNSGTGAYVDILFTMQGTSHLQLTNIQITGQTTNLSTGFDASTDAPSFQELSYEQVENGEFNVYKNSILILPKNTLVVGWNFRQNPCQGFNGGPTTFSTTPTYCFDQTQVWASTANSISVSRLSDPRNFLSIGAVHAATQGTIAMLQYIDGSTVLGYWGYLMSVLVRAKLANAQNTEVKLKCRLFTIAGLPSAASPTYPVASWDANGDPVFDGSITGRAPVDDTGYILGSTYENPGVFDPVCPAMAFNGISSEIITSSNANATLGILLYTVGTLDNATDNSIIFQSVSLVPNEFAIDDTPKTYDQVLRECQYYYESSYSNGVSPGTNNQEPSSVYVDQLANYSAPNISFVARSFGLTYRTVKRATPSGISFYSAKTGTGPTTVASYLRTAGASVGTEVDIDTGTNWETPSAGPNSLIMLAKNVTPQNATAGANTFPEAYIQFHYIIDSRLGA